MKKAAILAFPPLDRVPPPDLPLTGHAYDKYREYATVLLNSGRLNIFTKAKCENLGLVFAEIHKRVEFGRNVAAQHLETRDRLLRELQAIGESDATPSQEAIGDNRFSSVGSIIRRGAKKAEIRAS